MPTVFLLSLPSIEPAPQSAEKQLIRALLRRYRSGQHGRPTLNTSQPLSVRFRLGLIQLDLDETNNVLSLSMWSEYVSQNLRP